MTDTRTHDRPAGYVIPGNRMWALFLVSVLGLFLEMLLIRWIGTEVRIFAYMQNTVLVVCFLGLGLGCMTSRQPVMLQKTLFNLAFLALLLAIPVTREALGRISEMLSVLHDSAAVLWTNTTAGSLMFSVINLSIGLALTYLLMGLVVGMFVPIGRLLGRLMDEHPDTNRAYSVNVAGSLAGTWLFVLLSYYYQPPVVWVLVTVALTALFLERQGPTWRLNLALMVAMLVFSWFAGQQPGSTGVVWSPYQKLVLYKVDKPSVKDHAYQINVNNVGYQAMVNLDETVTRSHSAYYSPEMRGLSQYDIPFLLHPAPRTALLVGAGSGNDASGGLRHGVEKITAVDIDPAILSFGKRYHPEKPYSSSSVKLVNDDARSFFATCCDRYDVIVFGLLDSHTNTAMTNARLDNFVYTRESIARAKSLLADGGVMVLSFEVQREYIADRLAGVLKDVFGEEPVCFAVPASRYGFGGVMFIAGNLPAVREQVASNVRLTGLIEKWREKRPVNVSYTTRLTGDDWPYLYLERPGIPKLYYFMGALMLVLLVQSGRSAGVGLTPGVFGREHRHFFFLGAAFLLLEVQNISKASVVLGNTWDVNAVIVSGVLVMILVANLLARRFPGMHMGIVYAALLGVCLSLYFVDLASFAFLPYATKALVVGGLTTLPVLFGGIVFIRSFEAVPAKDMALGANLIGAVFGALAQSVTFVVGIKALLLVVMALYIAALLTRPRLLPSALPVRAE